MNSSSLKMRLQPAPPTGPAGFFVADQQLGPERGSFPGVPAQYGGAERDFE
jgi:hypothetical protein